MPARRILQLGDPMLREVSCPVASPADARLVLRDLRATLHQFQRAHGFGRGISAVQIGELRRIIYIEFAGACYGIVNPVFELQSAGKFRLWDDCFSFPNLLVRVERSIDVTLRYQDVRGEWHSLGGRGALSELLQHEMDHLDGILAVDRAVDRAIDRDSFCTRAEWLRRFA
jgi:peptide deformylase